MFCYAWLVLAIAKRGIAQLGGERRLMHRGEPYGPVDRRYDGGTAVAG